VTYRNPQNNPEYYKYYLYENTDHYKSQLSTRNKALIKSLDILCTSGTRFDDCGFDGLGVNYERTDTDYSVAEQTNFRNYLKTSLPNDVFNKIDWGTFAEIKDRKNTYVKMLMLFRKEAIDSLKDVPKSKAEFANSIEDFIKANNLRESLENLYPDVYNMDKQRDSFPQVKDPVGDSIKLIAEKLSITFAPETKSENPGQKKNFDIKRAQAFMSLRDNPVFQQLGAGFILALLQKGRPIVKTDNQGELLHVYIELSEDGMTKPHIWQTDENPKATLYKSFRDMQATINNRSIDPRVVNQLGRSGR